MAWTEEHPGAGQMSEITTFAVRLGMRKDAINRVGTAVGGARTEADSSVFGGLAGDAWRSSVDPLVTSLASVMAHLVTMKAAAETYKAGVDAIAASDAAFNKTLASKRATRNALAAHGGSTIGVQERIDRLDESIAGLKLSLHALAYQRKALDDAFCVALQPPVGADDARYAAMVATYGASAFTGNLVNFFALRDQKVDEYTELATKVAAGDASEEDIAKLTTFLTNTATDPALASAYWLSVGGDTTSALLSQLALDTEPSNMDALGVLAHTTESIRTSLSVGSATWDQDQAALFATGLFLSIPARTYGLDAISYLFNNPQGSPMGAKLTLSVATEFDSWERDPRYGNPGAVLLDRPAITPLGQLLFLENESLGDWDTAGNDPMARVFETLALYPEDALAFLSDPTPDPYFDADDGGTAPTTGNARIAYWYGERYWEYDGWSGAGALWHSALEAPGGITSGGDALDSVEKAQASVTAAVIEGLGSNPGFSSGSMSDLGAAQMGAAMSLELPRLVEGTMLYESSDPFGAVQVDYSNQDGMGECDEYWAPYVDDAALARALAKLSGNDIGQIYIQQGVEDYVGGLYDAASAEDPPISWTAALRRVTSVDAVVAGANGGWAEYQAAKHDAAIAQGTDIAGVVVGLVPFPGSEKAPWLVAHLGEKGADYALQVAGVAATEGSAEFVNSVFGDTLAGAQTQTGADLVGGMLSLGAEVDSLFDSPPPNFEEEFEGVHIDTYRSGLAQQYKDTYLSNVVQVRDDMNRDSLDDAYDAQLKASG